MNSDLTAIREDIVHDLMRMALDFGENDETVKEYRRVLYSDNLDEILPVICGWERCVEEVM